MAKQPLKTVEILESAEPVLKPRASSRLNSPAHLNPDEIAHLAHQLWQARGCPEGSPEIDWYQAEQQLRERVRVTTAHTARGSIRMGVTGATKSPRTDSRSRISGR